MYCGGFEEELCEKYFSLNQGWWQTGQMNEELLHKILICLFFSFSDVEDEKTKERSFVKVFFLTYHWYISAKDLMKKFIELYLFL